MRDWNASGTEALLLSAVRKGCWRSAESAETAETEGMGPGAR